MSQSLLLAAFHQHEWELLRFLQKRLGSASLATDIAHDLYVKLLRVEQPPPVRDYRAYIFTLAANLATDHLRVEGRRAEILREAHAVVWTERDDLDPERHALARAELAFMANAIAALPERSRRAFYLSRYEGRTQKEIAAILGTSLTSVYKDLRTALDALIVARRRFRDLPSGDDGEENS